MTLIPFHVLRLAILFAYFSIICKYKTINMPTRQSNGGS
ncbi:androgen-induced gene 1 protein-like [Polypterus senegalus]|nr:androgen-induced gene 1 protein-like [Polypterus senegalus]